jgi:cytochrome P450
MFRAMLIPPRVTPPARPLGRLAFLGRFVRNPLAAIPQAVYEEDLVPVGRANPRAIWVTSPELVKTVLLDERDKYRKIVQIRLLAPLLGKGILTSEGDDWRWQRRAAAGMFRAPDLKSFVPTFVRAAETVLARWREAPPASTHAIDADMTRATFDVISSTLLPSTDEGFMAGMQRSVNALQRFGGWDILYAYLQLPRWAPRPGGIAKARAMGWLRGAVMDLVRARKAARHAPDDLLQRLIAARDPESGAAMDDEQLVDNLLTFYLAGHETTAKALTWTLYLLARSPEWHARVRDEVERVTGGAPVAGEHLAQLVHTEQVLKESMRLFPPAPMMSRQTVTEATLGGVRLARGMSVLMPIYVIHRHARRWSDPDAFLPQRFAPEAEREIPRYQYMPFGAGPRVCIGMSFALMEATAILATLVRAARFDPVGDEPEPVAQVTLVPRGGIRLGVTVD